MTGDCSLDEIRALILSGAYDSPEAAERLARKILARGEEARLPAEFSGGLFELLIAATCKEEDELMAALDASAEGARSNG